MTLGPREERTLLPAESLGLDHCLDWTPQATGARGILHGKKAPLSVGTLALALLSTAAPGGVSGPQGSAVDPKLGAQNQAFRPSIAQWVSWGGVGVPGDRGSSRTWPGSTRALRTPSFL